MGFNTKLMDPIHLGSATASSTSLSNRSSPRTGLSMATAAPSFVSSGHDKSFLDDDWLINRVEHDSNMAMVAAGLVRPRSAFSNIQRSQTPVQGNPLAFRSLNNSKNSSPIASKTVIPPPSDYVCKLCDVAGHWLKDCHLFEPRQSLTGIGKDKLLGDPFGHLKTVTGNNSSNLQRGSRPPGNYVCRLCGVSGHWIDECKMFQPKSMKDTPSSTASAKTASGKHVGNSFKSIPPPPGYICNLCEQPGHWIQQCSRFEPIIPRHRQKERW